MGIRQAMLACAGVLALGTTALAGAGPAAAHTRPHLGTIRPDQASDYSGYITLYDYNYMGTGSQCDQTAYITDSVYSNGVCGWEVDQLPDGYDVLVALVAHQLFCLNVSNARYQSGTDLLLYPCNPDNPPLNEQFREWINTPDGHYPQAFYLVPAGDWNLCLNVSGGLGAGHRIILYSCNSQNNEAFYFPDYGVYHVRMP